LKNRLGKIERYALDAAVAPAFWAQVTRVELCQSTHPALSLCQHKPIVRVEMTVLDADESVKH
jgi:hypothetical protein